MRSKDKTSELARGRARVSTAMSALVVAFGSVFATLQGASAETKTCEKQDEIKLQEYAGLIQNIVAWAGIESGTFERHCLKAVMVPIPSAPAAYAASVQGGVHFVSTAPETALVPYSQGMDIKIVAGMNSTIHYALVVRKDLEMPHEAEGYPAVMKDLVGKRIGVNALGSTTNALARANFIAAGLNPDDANWVAYGAPPAGIAALQNGTVDAIQLWSDGMDIAATLTGGKVIGDLRDPETKTLPVIATMRGASLEWAAQSSYIEENPEVVERFVAANSEAIAWIKDPANFDAVVGIVRERAPSPEGVADREALLLQRVRQFIPQVSAELSVSALQGWAQFAYDNGRVPELIDVKSLIWEGSKDIIVP
ncbi:ABC transporter substrate-binding protein [Arvimicrobium flavum]|uniref:ABC transporter substrate-binding protein n=1 Tax=Arvimicrobium flavum TaxID=3393320 RepID=UPI00237C275D|nr:ABC transporter substrate-binding protein [Mesorhizobium shangrilense]